MSVPYCGPHEIYVADVVGVEKLGKIVVVTVCRHCDQVNFHEHSVGGPMKLKSEKETK